MSDREERAVKFASALMQKRLTANQKKQVSTLVKHHADSKLPENELVMRIALDARESFMNGPTKFMSYDTEFDLHEMLSSMLMEPFGPNDLGAAVFQAKAINQNKIVLEDQYDFSGMFDKDTLLSLTRSFNPAATHKTAYLTLDSSVAEFLDDNTKLRWDYLDILTETPTSTNTNGKIRDVIAIRIHSIVMAKFSSTMDRATVLIDEFSTQSFIAPNGRKFHTINSLFDLEIPNLVNATIAPVVSGFSPDISHDKYALFNEYSYNNGIYHFNTPITTFDSLTLSFGDPFELIPIKKYQLKRCIFDSINYIATALFPLPGWAGVFVIDTVEQHFHTGDIQSIKISGFSTDQPVVDALLIEYINNMEFTSASVLDATHIEIRPQHVLPPGPSPNPLSYTGVGLPNTIVGNPTMFTMTFEGYRVIATIEMTYLDSKFN